MGKLFSDTMRRGREESFGREESEDSSSERRARRALKQAWVRAPLVSWDWELRRRVSLAGKVEEHEAVV